MLAIIQTAAETANSQPLEATHSYFAIGVLMLFLILFIYVIAGSLFEHFELFYLHESGLAIMLGGIVGFSYYVYNTITGKQELHPISFDEESFFYFLLPPIIFSSGYNLKTSKFFAYMPYTLIFGIVGTFINFGTTFGLTALANYLGGVWVISDLRIEPVDLNINEMLLFSSTICSSDTVAAMTLLKFNDHPKLYSVVVGEGLANDAVSIILYQAVSKIVLDGTSKKNSLFLQSYPNHRTQLGYAFSHHMEFHHIGICEHLHRHCYRYGFFTVSQKTVFLDKNPSAQMLTVFGFGYLSYIVSEIFELSGIITLLMSGIVMSHYTFYNLSQSAKISTGSTFNSLSLLAEGFIFMYLGVSAFFYASDDWSITLILIEVGVVVVARFAGIFFTTLIAKLVRCVNWKLNYRELGVVWFAGLVRGAIALGLILKAPVNPLLRSTVNALVLITTVILGAIMPSFISGMVGSGPDVNADPASGKIRRETPHYTINLFEEHIYKYKHKEYGYKMHFYWRLFDDTFLKPWLIRNYDPDTHRLHRRLKFSEFGPGKLNLEEDLQISGMKRPKGNSSPCESPLTESLIKKGRQNEEEAKSTLSKCSRIKEKAAPFKYTRFEEVSSEQLSGSEQEKDHARSSSLPGASQQINLEIQQDTQTRHIELRNEFQLITERKKQHDPLEFD